MWPYGGHLNSTYSTISTIGSNKEVSHLVSNRGSCKLPLSTKFLSLSTNECRNSSELEDSSHGEEPLLSSFEKLKGAQRSFPPWRTSKALSTRLQFALSVNKVAGIWNLGE